MKRSLLLSLLTLSLAAQASAEQTTWVRDPHIAPDGQSVAFVVRGQVRVVPTRGGVSVPVTPGGASASAPVWSPDSKTLAFASDVNGDKDVFVMPVSGGAMARRTFSTLDETPTAFSPDGKEVLFTAERLGDAQVSRFGGTQLYTTPTAGGRTRLLLPTRSDQASWNAAGTQLVYQYQSSVDHPARQHRVAANANEIWLYDPATRRHTPLIQDGKDARNPVWSPDGKAVYYLSERSGILNVWRRDLASGKDQQLTQFSGQPVRGLSISRTGDLAFSQAGALYLLPAGAAQPQRIQVDLPEGRDVEAKTYSTSLSSELAVSPDGALSALTARGDIFLVDKKGHSFQVTHTPEEERFVNFSPDGKTLVYASPRREGGVLDWRIYKTDLPKNAKDYALAGAFKETLLNTGAGTAQGPVFSPDGKKVAFVYERREVRVLDIASGKVTTLYGKDDLLTSYRDGMIQFRWSPDSRLLLVPWRTVSFSVLNRWAVVPADGSGKLQPISARLANVNDALWSADGSMMLALTPRDSERRLDGTPTTLGLYRIFLSPQSRSDFLKYADDQEDKDGQDDKKAADAETTSPAPVTPPNQPQPNQPQPTQPQPTHPQPQQPKPVDKPASDKKADDQKADTKKPEQKAEPKKPAYTFAPVRDSRLEEQLLDTDVTAVLALPDDPLNVLLLNVESDKLLLRRLNLATKKTEDAGEVSGLDTDHLSLDINSLSKDGQTLTVLAGNKIYHIPLEDPSKAQGTEYTLRQQQVPAQMRQAAFDLAWLDLKQTFYTPDLHGVDWDAAYRTYSAYLSDVATPAELAELIDELSGSLNASHLFPSSSYVAPRARDTEDTDTASLGIFTDDSYSGPGVRIAALLPGGPLDRADLDIKAGDIITSINGKPVPELGGLDAVLDGLSGQRVQVGVRRGSQERQITVKPISIYLEILLNQRRITDTRRAEVERLSGGKLAYTYLPGMNNTAFVNTFNDLLTMQTDRQGAVLDIRANEGGDLYHQLMNFLTAKPYAIIGRKDRPNEADPTDRWYKPSALITDSFAYSDGSVFPQSYQDMKVGPVVGTLQLNTGTGVNFISSNLIPELTYSVPVQPMRRLDGSYYENNVIRPDILIPHDPNAEQAGRDLALEAAVAALLKK